MSVYPAFTVSLNELICLMLLPYAGTWTECERTKERRKEPLHGAALEERAMESREGGGTWQSSQSGTAHRTFSIGLSVFLDSMVYCSTATIM